MGKCIWRKIASNILNGKLNPFNFIGYLWLPKKALIWKQIYLKRWRYKFIFVRKNVTTKAYRAEGVNFHISLTSALNGGERSASRPGPLFPREECPLVPAE